MSFPRYPKYKASGVEWLGEVPEHWALPPLYLRYEVVLGKMLDTDKLTGTDSLPYLRNTDVQWDSVNAADLPVIDIRPDEVERFTVRPGDLLVCEGGDVGRTAIWRSSNVVAFQKALHRLRPLTGAEDPRFFYYCMKFAASTGIFVAGGNPNTIPHLTGESFRLYRLPKPPVTEQRAIASFLDRETAKIDALVAEQQRLMELLKEKRQAVISHAVTKGLNPDAPMKPSGVEWLGDVPAHWQVQRLKFALASMKAGPFGSALTKDMYVTSGFRVYGQEQVIPGDFAVGDYFISRTRYDELAQYSVAAGDILVSCVGTFGKIALVPHDIKPGIINPRLIRVRTGSTISAAYLIEVLRSSVTFEQFSSLTRGGTMDVINIGTLNELFIALPPSTEQSDIASFIDNQHTVTESLRLEAERNVELLLERRTALISAAVTGQIDVSHLTPEVS